MLGGAGSSVAIGDIAASDAAQTGEEQFVTVDANGTLGVSNAATAASVQNVRVAVESVAAISDAQFNALSNRVTDLGFRMEELDESLSGGIAAAAALGSAIVMPDKSFVLSGNVANYNGEQGFAMNFTGRVSDSVAVGAGFAGSTGDGEVIAQAGFALGF